MVELSRALEDHSLALTSEPPSTGMVALQSNDQHERTAKL